MSLNGLTAVDIIGLIFLAFAMIAFVWAIVRHAQATSDEEASAVLWETAEPADVAPRAAMSSASRRRGKLVFIAMFVLIVALMAAIPAVTIILAQRTPNAERTDPLGR